MKNNKNELQKKAFNDLFSETNNNFTSKTIIEEDKPQKLENTKKIQTKRKTYNIPVDIVEDMEKIVYIDRDIKDNTELLIIALRNYLDSKTCKDLLMEYDKLKGIQ